MKIKDMSEVNDGFVECPKCHSRYCYVQNTDGKEVWMCLGCGYTSTTNMKEGSETEQVVSDRQPQLYRDLKFVDTDGYVWYPAVVTVPEKGMVYIDGTNVEDWEWVATPMRKLTGKELRSKKYRKQRYVANTDKTERFGKEEGFLKAADAIGFFEQ